MMKKLFLLILSTVILLLLCSCAESAPAVSAEETATAVQTGDEPPAAEEETLPDPDDPKNYRDLVKETKQYKLYSGFSSGLDGHCYHIYDLNGNIIETGILHGLVGEQHFTYMGNNVLALRSPGDCAYYSVKYYHLATGEISSSYPNPIGVYAGIVAYFDEEKLVIEDVFSPETYRHVIEDERFTPSTVESVSAPQDYDREHLSVRFRGDQSEVLFELISVPPLPSSDSAPDVTR